ncbi:transketolase family protein [Muricomes intestini]|uniref:transketolase family protein n=1 Tax=Muricomes intestini TaxID=1796634 RepID=UPI002FE004FA
MNKITNRQTICKTLMEAAKTDKEIIVLCSDSRGSASMTPFAKEYPEQFIEVGIAEQNLVSVSAGLAPCGKKAFVFSPASFLSTRSYEQAKIDVAYSDTNVKLVGISGGISYGALGMSHHSCQDIAAFTALPDMRVYLPSDRYQTASLVKELLKDKKPAYIRVSRSASTDLYDEKMKITLDKAKIAKKEDGRCDVCFVACGEMVAYAVRVAEELEKEGVKTAVVDMYCLKPFDRGTVIAYAKKSKCMITVEEHSVYGGLGSLVAQTTADEWPIRVKQIGHSSAVV